MEEGGLVAARERGVRHRWPDTRQLHDENGEVGTVKERGVHEQRLEHAVLDLRSRQERTPTVLERSVGGCVAAGRSAHVWQRSTKQLDGVTVPRAAAHIARRGCGVNVERAQHKELRLKNTQIGQR